MRTRFFIAAAFLAAGAGQASAGGGAFCDAYVKNAMIDVHQAISLDCGFHGTRWSTDPNVHRRWCVEANEDLAKEEDLNRHRDLNMCGFCRPYADSAAAAEATNLKLGCGFSGPEWQTDVRAHLGWCIGLNPKVIPDATDAQTAKRTSAIQDCKAQKLQEAAKAGIGGKVDQPPSLQQRVLKH